MSFWNMTYGDQLRGEIANINKPRQRNFFLKVLERMGAYVQRYDESLTFREYFDMMGYNEKKKSSE